MIIFLLFPASICWWTYGICWMLGGPEWLEVSLLGIACIVSLATVLLFVLRTFVGR